MAKVLCRGYRTQDSGSKAMIYAGKPIRRIDDAGIQNWKATDGALETTT
jgi:hypothetical protein